MTDETANWRDRICRTCGHPGGDHEASECWVRVDGKQCGCTWFDLGDDRP